MPTKTTTGDLTVELTYLTRALKAPTMRDAITRLAERARADSWTHEQFLAACLEREVTARAAQGGEIRVEAAKFPARKSLDDFDFTHTASIKRDQIAHLSTLDFIATRENVVLLGLPGTRKTHLATGLAIKACHARHRVDSPPPRTGSPALPQPTTPKSSPSKATPTDSKTATSVAPPPANNTE